MNFEVINIRFFSIGVDYHPRIYAVMKKRNGLLRLTNKLTGEVFIDNLNENTVLINNVPMQNISQLQNVVFNQSCLCDDYGGDDSKIFDRTFDKTFE